jgi:hypothetical protein
MGAMERRLGRAAVVIGDGICRKTTANASSIPGMAVSKSDVIISRRFHGMVWRSGLGARFESRLGQ